MFLSAMPPAHVAATLTLQIASEVIALAGSPVIVVGTAA